MFEYQTTGTFIRFVVVFSTMLLFQEFVKAGGQGVRWVGRV